MLRNTGIGLTRKNERWYSSYLVESLACKLTSVFSSYHIVEYLNCGVQEEIEFCGEQLFELLCDDKEGLPGQQRLKLALQTWSFMPIDDRLFILDLFNSYFSKWIKSQPQASKNLTFCKIFIYEFSFILADNRLIYD